jgi:hypothetical protein
MESYTVKIAPGVTETVMATSPEEARRKVRILIADKGTRNIYDKLYFDYDTGVNKRGIRRKLAQAEISKRGDERELVLDRIVGSGGHVKNTKGQIAITPTGMRELGLEVPKIRLADGTVLEQNTVVDEKGFDLRNDLADFAGVAGPIAGAIGMMRPGSRVLEFFKNTPRFGRMAGASIGSAGGKGVEEYAELLRDVQLQSTGEIANLLKQEALLGGVGQGVGELVGAAYIATLGKRTPIDEGRMLEQINKGRNAPDIYELDRSLGRKATEKEIQDAIATGKVRVSEFKFVPGQKTIGREIPGRLQAVTETVFGNKRLNDQRDYFAELFGNLSKTIGAADNELEKFISQSTKETLDEQIEIARNALVTKEQNVLDTLNNLVENTIDDAFEIGNRAAITDRREFGLELAQGLGKARTFASGYLDGKYTAVNELFDNLKDRPGRGTNTVKVKVDNRNKNFGTLFDRPTQILQVDPVVAKGELIDQVIKDTIKINKARASEIYQEYVNNFGKGRSLDPNNQYVELLNKAIQDPRTDLQYFRNLSSISSAQRVFMREPTAARATFTDLMRTIDNFSGASGTYREGGSILKDLSENSFETIVERLPAYNNLRKRAGLQPMNFTDSDFRKIQNAVKELRKANKDTYEIESIFNRIPEASIVEDATRGAFDGDEVFDTLVMKGDKQRLNSVLQALKVFNRYKNNVDKKYLKDLPYENVESELKAKLKQRLFQDFVDKSTDYSTNRIVIQEFARKLQAFERSNPGKLDILFTDSSGINTANRVKTVIDQMVKLKPDIAPNKLRQLISEFNTNPRGLSEVESNIGFIDELGRLARASEEKLRFNANKSISELPNKTVEEITETIFRPNAASNIEELKLIVSPEVFQSVQRTSMQRILENALDIQGRGSINDILKPGRLKTSLDSYGDETLDAMFGTKFRQELRNIQRIMDTATRGEVGRGGGAGTLVAATIAVNAFNINMLPTVAGLAILREVFSNPKIVGLLGKTDKGSVLQVLDAFEQSLRQLGIRAINDQAGIISDTVTEALGGEEAQSILEPIREGVQETIQSVQDVEVPTLTSNIELPDIEPVTMPNQGISDERLAFAERLSGRRII